MRPQKAISYQFISKQTRREKDIPDRLFLHDLLARQGAAPGVDDAKPAGGAVPGWLKRLLGIRG